MHEDTVFTPMLPHRQVAEHFEAMSEMGLSGYTAQDGMERRQGECLLVGIAQWPLQRCKGSRQLRLLLREARE